MSDTYLFIDGGYLRRVHADFNMDFFGVPGELDMKRVSTGFGHYKAFYYDCLNDVRLLTETDADFEARIAKEEAFFNGIRLLPGYHVRLGTTSGSHKKIRQKQVDVLMAVEMLAHAYAKNMNKAVLLAGDLDFKPIVDELISHGTWVTVAYEKKSASRELIYAADEGKDCTTMLYHFNAPDFWRMYPCPSSQMGVVLGGLAQVKRGTHKVTGTPVVLSKGPDDFLLHAADLSPLGPQNTALRHPDAILLEKWFVMQYGDIAWG